MAVNVCVNYWSFFKGTAIKTKFFTDRTMNSDCSRQVFVFQGLHYLQDKFSHFQGIDK